MNKIKVAIVGCGAIGSELAKFIDRGMEGIELAGVCDKNRKKLRELVDNLLSKPEILSLEEAVEKADLVVETASVDAVEEVLKLVIEKKKDALILSIGGILKNPSLLEKAKEKGCSIYLPSGAIAGIDGIKAGREGGLKKVTLTTYKHPRGLREAPWIKKKGLNLDNLKEKKLLFEGSAKEAIEGFPQNINVAALLSLAGIGEEKTKVRIVADPSLTTNIHKLEGEGDFGKIEVRVESVTSPSNPKTSYLAILSALSTLKKIVEKVEIGT